MQKRHPASLGLVIAVVAAASFGMSGAFIKPLLESGWSPVAAVTARALIGGIVLLPFALVAVRGRWAAVWRGRWRLLGMALVGVAGTQVLYFAAIQRIPVSTSILVEYLAPVLLVVVVWTRTRRAPHALVLTGSAAAVAGLVLVVSPGGDGGLDPFGLLLAVLAMAGCAAFYVIAARPSDGLPPVALAAGGLLLGGAALAVVGATGLLPVSVSFADVPLFGRPTAWWVPLLVVGVIATAIAYAASVTATELLGSRLASFTGLLEVVAATVYAWLLLGEQLGPLQLLGGALNLGGIALVRAEPRRGREREHPSAELTGSAASASTARWQAQPIRPLAAGEPCAEGGSMAAHEPDDEDKSTMDVRLTGVRDPKDPDGLLTIEQDADRPDPSRYGTPETDTLEREQEYVARLGDDGTADDLPRVPPKRGVTGLG